MVIPKQYKTLIADIADYIGSGLNCYVNTDTLEMESVPQNLVEDPDEYEMMTGETFESLKLKHPSWKNCIDIEPLESYESFQIMESFVEQVPDLNLRQQLINALNRRKPFANFKNLIDYSAYRQDWFDYRQAKLEKYVYGLLKDAIDNNN